MTAQLGAGPCARCRRGLATLLAAVTATTSNASGERSTRSRVERADRPGRAEDRERAAHAQPRHLQRGGQHRHRHQPVEPVEQPAVAGQPVAAVLDPGAALHPAFEQVAALRGDGEQRREQIKRGPSRSRSAHSRRTAPRAAIPPIRPSTVLFGLIAGASLRRPIRAAGEIGADVGRPGDDEHPHRPAPARCRSRSRIHSKASAGSKA